MDAPPIMPTAAATSDSPRLLPARWTHQTALAPMEGVSHANYREIMAAGGGVGLVCTEFVRITDTIVSIPALTREVVRAPGVPLCVQVMGNHVAHMADAARLVIAAGADIVDINLGCPAPKAVRKGVGSAMLTNPTLLREVVDAMRAAVPGTLSAKIRAGMDRADDVVDTALLLQDAGVDYLVVHPRRRIDFYDGVADWRIIKRLVDALDIPVVGNGDCWYAADTLRMMEETGCAAVMLGRPALRNPWIFQQIADLKAGRTPFDPSGADLARWFEDLVTLYRGRMFGRKGPIGKVKELVTWIGRGVGDGSVWKKAALRCNDLDDIIATARDMLTPIPASGMDLDAYGRLALERSGSADLSGPSTLPDQPVGPWLGPSRSGSGAA